MWQKNSLTATMNLQEFGDPSWMPLCSRKFVKHKSIKDKPIKRPTLVITLFLTIGLKATSSVPLSCCPQNVSAPPTQSGQFSSDATTFIANPPAGGGCSLTYLDENLQPLQSPGLNQNPSQQMSANLLQSNYSYLQQLQLITTSTSVGLDCQYITAEQLHDKFNRIKPAGLRVSSLIVKNSILTTLSNLPQGFHDLKRLSISNTSIDLEVLKEGSESLNQLTTLEIINEKISNIPQNFFQEMQSLRELRLENDEIASLDSDAFHNLDDSLEVLVLRRNRFNRFPMAVKNLGKLAVLDLSDNDIVLDTQENDLPEKLEPLLNLSELVMNRINCTCEFSSSPFFEWIARTHISGVRCFAPEKFVSKEVIVFERDEFCARQSSARPIAQLDSITSFLLLFASLASTRQLYPMNNRFHLTV